MRSFQIPPILIFCDVGYRKADPKWASDKRDPFAKAGHDLDPQREHSRTEGHDDAGRPAAADAEEVTDDPAGRRRDVHHYAAGVIACVPALYGRGQQAAAAVSLAYNIGVGGFCRSTAARHFRAGRWREGCNAFLMWNRAGGRVVRGLTLRRQRERDLCVVGLA